MNATLRLCTCLVLSLPLGACEAPMADDPSHPAEAKDHAITVSGEGTAWGTPDVLDVNLGVSLVRPTVAEAVDEATRRAKAAVDALMAKGVSRDDIQTQSYTIGPEYRTQDKGQRLEGYRVTNTVRVRIRDLKRAGEIVDAAVSAGGDGAVVNALSFSISDPKPLLEKAREQAWKDAYGKAKQLAELADVGLGDPLSVEEGVSAPPIPLQQESAAALSAGAVTPIEPGQSKIVVKLSVAFAIGESPFAGTQ